VHSDFYSETQEDNRQELLVGYMYRLQVEAAVFVEKPHDAYASIAGNVSDSWASCTKLIAIAIASAFSDYFKK